VDRGGGGETHFFADLAHRRRVAPLAGLAVDEFEDLLLAGGERGPGHGGLSCWVCLGFWLAIRSGVDIEQVFDTLESINEHLYVENMFAERVFRVKYPLGSVVTPHRQD